MCAGHRDLTQFDCTGDLCTVEPCLNGATCQFVDGNQECQCTSGFSGRRCESSLAAGADLCAADPCLNGATCQFVNGIQHCQCTSEFSGRRCEIDLCAAAPCLNGATCQIVSGDQVCQSITGFSGSRCETVGSHAVSAGNLSVTMKNKYFYGDWGSVDVCSTGSYAAGIQLTIQDFQGDNDDTAVNVIRLLCKQAWGSFPEVDNVTSATMIWGDVQPKVYCPDDYWIVAFRLFYGPYVHYPGDDTAVNGMKVTCRGPGMGGTLTHNIAQRITWSSSRWSSWSSTCPPGTAICALKTKVEAEQGADVDDGALTDALLYCCDF